MKSQTILIITLFLFLKVNAQETTYYGHYEIKNTVKSHILVDSLTKTNFILDSSRIVITAVDSSGNIIWYTDPWKDNKLQAYRFKRPLITSFDFRIPDWIKQQNVIGVGYNNTQFGTVDRKTGKFTFYGQD